MNTTTASKIRELRRQKGFTQREMAELIGVSEGAIGMYETGERIPKDDIKIKISKLFDKPVGYIFFNEKLAGCE